MTLYEKTLVNMDSIESNNDEEEEFIEEELTEEELQERWKNIFKDLVDQGIIVPDQDAPPCVDCKEKLEEIAIKVMMDDTELFEDSFKWVKGLDQFVVSPSFYGFVKESIATFNARCSKCGGAVMDLEITDNPHGLKFGEMTRMAGKL